MSWAVIVRKEVDDAIRSRMLWAIVALIAAMVSLTMVVTLLIPGQTASIRTALSGAAEFGGMLVPIMALVAAYLSIAGERESGSLKILLGLPPSRGEVLLGKFVGRSVVVVVGVAVGFGLAGVVGFAVFQALPIVPFLGMIALTAALGVVFVGIAVGISAATATRSRAMTYAIAVYLLLTLLWDLLPQMAMLVAYGAVPTGASPGWVVFLGSVNPSGAYSMLVTWLLGGGGQVTGVAARFGGQVPFYLSWWFLLGLLALWLVVPLLLGYRQFQRADLG
ncbi:MAG: ABC transporter permease [Halodesulfurarchaeum sp.]